MQKAVSIIICLFISIFMYAGCSDSGDDPVTPNGGDNNDSITWSADIQPLFNSRCVSCHGVSGGLDLSTYTTALQGGNRGVSIVANDADNSLLVQLLEGEAQGVSQMPQSGPYFSQEEVQKVKDWINDGALNN